MIFLEEFENLLVMIMFEEILIRLILCEFMGNFGDLKMFWK